MAVEGRVDAAITRTQFCHQERPFGRGSECSVAGRIDDRDLDVARVRA